MRPAPRFGRAHPPSLSRHDCHAATLSATIADRPAATLRLPRNGQPGLTKVHVTMLLRVALLLLLTAASPVASGEIKSVSSDGFVLAYSQRIDAAATKVFAALSSIDRWWNSDHTYSGDAANLSLTAEAGSCFCERWKDGAVEHGRVIMVMRDRLLRVQAALGPLQSRALNGILTFQLKPDEQAGDRATLLTMTYVVNGSSVSALDKSAPAVNDVLGEQFARLARFIETGKAAAP
jgi:uncharacterized protein YndB with AHSA1/START domain